jgi:hypothetical protein
VACYVSKPLGVRQVAAIVPAVAPFWLTLTVLSGEDPSD